MLPCNMITNSGGQQRVKQLPERPSINDIKRFLTDASKERGVRFNYAWRSEQGEQFTLAVKHVSPTGKTCEWHLYQGAEGKRQELWFHLTDNTLHIYDSILGAIGEDSEAATRADGMDTFTALPTYGSNKVHPNRVGAAELGQTFDSIRFDAGEMALAPVEETLKGNLKLVHITNLLQSIGLGQMSGRLRVKRHSIWADIFFNGGEPAHAEGSRGVGEDCLLQVICWEEGDFEFEPKIRSEEKSILRPLDTLILEGVLLHDHTTYLTAAGIRMATVLSRVRPNLSEIEFEQVVQAGAPSEARKLKTFYLEVDGEKTLEDIITKLDLVRSRWVPIVADLLRCNLIKLLSSKKATGDRVMHGKMFDSSLSEAAKQSLIERKTGIYSYASFLLLLTELIRCSNDFPVSVLVMEVQPSGSQDQGKVELSAEQVQELAWKIDESCNFKGIVSHYDRHDFAVILPGLAADKASRRADRLLKSLISTGLQTGSQSTQLVVSIGIACHPDDAGDMGALLGEADRARERGRKSGSGISLAKPPSM